MATRKTTTAKAAATTVNGAEHIDVSAQTQRATDTQYAYQAYCESLGVNVPGEKTHTFKNMIMGFVSSVLTMIVGYAAALQLTEALATAVLIYTGWYYLAFSVYMVGLVIDLILVIYAGGKVAEWVATGGYARSMEKIGGWVKSKFVRASKAVGNTSLHAKQSIFRATRTAEEVLQ